MEKRRGINLVGLYEKLVELAAGSRKPFSWGFTAKERDKLKKPGKALAAKKKHRKVVEASRRRNR